MKGERLNQNLQLLLISAIKTCQELSNIRIFKVDYIVHISWPCEPAHRNWQCKIKNWLRNQFALTLIFKPPHDVEVLSRVKQQMLDYVRQQRKNGSYLFLETAGGIHSPVMSGKKFRKKCWGYNFFLIGLKFRNTPSGFLQIVKVTNIVSWG